MSLLRVSLFLIKVTGSVVCLKCLGVLLETDDEVIASDNDAESSCGRFLSLDVVVW